MKKQSESELLPVAVLPMLRALRAAGRPSGHPPLATRLKAVILQRLATARPTLRANLQIPSFEGAAMQVCPVSLLTGNSFGSSAQVSLMALDHCSVCGLSLLDAIGRTCTGPAVFQMFIVQMFIALSDRSVNQKCPIQHSSEFNLVIGLLPSVSNQVKNCQCFADLGLRPLQPLWHMTCIGTC